MVFTDQNVQELKRDIDLNGDGKVEFIEFKKEMERIEAHENKNWNLFLSIDTNHDSLVSKDEWTKFQKKVGGNNGNVAIGRWMAKADTNKDGSLSCPEFLDVFER